jgi:hypothetical protein
MFSQRITNSGRFLKMPISTQVLYFHLNLNADDDGVVEAYSVMRSTGIGEDDLKVLAAKNYVRILNNDLVTWITDWREHNLIRADRKSDSIHKNLLLTVVPEAELIEPKTRADLKGNNDDGRPVDVQWTTNGRHRLGKVRLGKERIRERGYTCAKDFSSLKDLTSEVVEEVANKYDIPISLVESVREDLELYTKSKGKTYKDYKATLMSWVRREKAKLSIEAKKLSKKKGGVLDARSIK